ncbi:hypothetical protein SOL01_19150 [Streptococcus cristatus]|uniref:Degenerate transposase n=2 Tax=Streptococcus cristatus TaxID=45634 RepID=A0A512AEC0_STRCR|nr:hypothetical protein SOL01_19150 [Streptococcus cristatus]
MIEAYYQENIKVSDIVTSLGRSKQTIYNVINYLKEGHSAYDYYNRYKINKKRCGRNKTSLTQSEKDFIQTHLEKNWSLDVIKGTYPDRVSCSMRTLYRLADRGILKKEDLPWKGKRKPMVIAKNEENKHCAEIYVREQTVILILRRNSVI